MGLSTKRTHAWWSSPVSAGATLADEAVDETDGEAGVQDGQASGHTPEHRGQARGAHRLHAEAEERAIVDAATEALRLEGDIAALHPRGILLGDWAELGDTRWEIGGRVFALGEDGMASAERLHTDIDFIGVPAIVVDGEAVSSSVIRIAIVSGNCELASKMLGRNYAVSGIVADGEKRGREIGFPTANIEPQFPATVPENGIYATLVEVDGETHKAATSIGVRPTFETDGGRTIEAYLLDFDGDLYTKRLRLEFVTRLRAEVAFDSVEQLVEQMNKDVEQTRQILASNQ